MRSDALFVLEKTQLFTYKRGFFRLIISQKNLNRLVLLFCNDKQANGAVWRQGCPQTAFVFLHGVVAVAHPRVHRELQHVVAVLQQKITSKEKGGIVYLVQSKTNKDNFLALYENPDGIILNVKKININANDKEAIVALSKIDDTYFFTAQAEKEQSVVNILSYNDKILTISQTRNGCSLSIGGAGIIWGTAFGALSMGAGAAASLVFLLMAEALC